MARTPAVAIGEKAPGRDVKSGGVGYVPALVSLIRAVKEHSVESEAALPSLLRLPQHELRLD